MHKRSRFRGSSFPGLATAEAYTKPTPTEDSGHKPENNGHSSILDVLSLGENTASAV